MAKESAISFRVDPHLKETLEKAAKADRRPLASFLTIILEDWCVEQGHWPEGSVVRFGDEPKRRK